MHSLLKAALFSVATAALPTTLKNSQTEHTFGDIPVRPDLEWTPCYGGLQCANLEVPLDYQDKALGSTHVAWIRKEAGNGTSKTDIIYNPGGPGNPGISDIINGGGDNLIKLFGGKYNIVSFDPRGVNNSGIDLTCFPGNPDTRDSVYSDMESFELEQERYAGAVALGKWCTAAASSDSEIRYAGTSAVVQDMMHFTELQAAKYGKKAEEALIWYFGTSYGTVIGQTLAQMYPDRIGRVIVDANVKGEDHYNGLIRNAVSSADGVLGYFFTLCAEAGPEKCKFAGTSKDAAEMKKRFDSLLETLDKNPLQSIDAQLGRPYIFTKANVLETMHGWLYRPWATFPDMASGLDFLEKGNATGWSLLTQGSGSEPVSEPFNYTSGASREVLHLVTAIDSAGRYPIKNLDEYITAAKEMAKTSTWGQKYARSNMLINAGMDIQPPKSQLFPGFKKTTTKNPVLFINTRFDPITPLSSAKHMSQYFQGSTVLTQNSGGHSFLWLVSKCTRDHILAYLNEAKMPEEGTVCEAGWKPLVEKEPLPLFWQN